MLISFAMENFKSFAARTKIELLARKSDKTIRSALIPADLPGTKAEALLPAMAIYGPNASGKTNFLLAMLMLRRAVLNSQTNWSPTRQIPLDPHLAHTESPTTFEIVFVSDDVRYRYGFKASKVMFIEEWLYSYPKGRERDLFFRTTEQVEGGFNITINVGATFSGQRRDHESTSRRVRQNSLFLSACAQDNQEDAKEIYEWFQRNLLNRATMDLSNTDKSVTSMLADEFDDFRSLLKPLVRLADSSIDDIVIKKLELENDESDGDIRKRAERYDVEFVLNDGGRKIVVDQQRESRGIKRLYALAADLITALKYGRVIVVDELETSMHSQVASQILALFQNKASNPKGAQVIFTTHETRLLNLQHLRRDQIWFCERRGISSELYPLYKFSPRQDENFEAGYLRGRYGAVPLASIDPEWIMAVNDEQILDDEESISA